MPIQDIRPIKNKTRSNAVCIAACMGMALLAFMPGMAMAAPWDTAASQVLAIFTGGLTRTIAIIAVIGLGIAAMAGKLSWRWAINIILGIVFIFGSTAFVDYIISASS